MGLSHDSRKTLCCPLWFEGWTHKGESERLESLVKNSLMLWSVCLFFIFVYVPLWGSWQLSADLSASMIFCICPSRSLFRLGLPSSSSLALTVRMVEPTSASSSTSTSYIVCAKTGLLSFTSLMKIRTYAVSEEREQTHARLNKRCWSYSVNMNAFSFFFTLSLSVQTPSPQFSPLNLLSLIFFFPVFQCCW